MILNRRINRRDFLKTIGLTVAATAVAQASGGVGAAGQAAAPTAQSGGMPFKAIKPVTQNSARPVVAEGHNMSIVIRWGEPLTADAPAFDPKNLTAAAHEKQFGYNCDFVGVQPHPDAPNDANRALMVVNHEYTNPELMFSKWKGGETSATKQTVLPDSNPVKAYHKRSGEFYGQKISERGWEDETSRFHLVFINRSSDLNLCFASR